MTLLPDWRAIAARAWSLRLIELAALADIILNVVPSLDFLPWWVTVVLLGGAWAARLLIQPEAAQPSGEKNADQ